METITLITINVTGALAILTLMLTQLERLYNILDK